MQAADRVAECDRHEKRKYETFTQLLDQPFDDAVPIACAWSTAELDLAYFSTLCTIGLDIAACNRTYGPADGGRAG